jgi:hypothetical protein
MAKPKPGRKTAPKATSKRKGGTFKVTRTPAARAETEENVHKYEATREPAPAPAYEELGELPTSYGESNLFLIARDPHWLFSYWDFDWGMYPAAAMRDGDLKFYLKLYAAGRGEESTIEINPEARNWYIPVHHASTAYRAEIGFFDRQGEWSPIVQSQEAVTPSDSVSQEAAVSFATVPFHLSFQRLVEMVRSLMMEGESLIDALSRLQGEGRRLAFGTGKTPAWTEEQRRILAALFGDDMLDTLSMGSAEIDKLLRKRMQQRLFSESASGLMAQWGPGVSSLFSGVGASWSAQPFSKPRGFFMHVNAELIFYGGTHPDATVWVDGKQVRLNADGSFRYHFKFPDGDFEIPIVAESPDKVEQRTAVLSFKRGTIRKGDVGHTGQPAHLKKPIGKKK